jgi:arabinan endo-1,5-alpha-L-arabinosidase
MTGALTGNWSYDATKKQLKLGNVIVCVEREVDWEATPRRVTFVYAGTEKNLNATYWGKRKKIMRIYGKDHLSIEVKKIGS